MVNWKISSNYKGHCWKFTGIKTLVHVVLVFVLLFYCTYIVFISLFLFESSLYIKKNKKQKLRYSIHIQDTVIYVILLIWIFIVGFNSIKEFQYALFFYNNFQCHRKNKILKFLNFVKPKNKYRWIHYCIRNIGFKWFSLNIWDVLKLQIAHWFACLQIKIHIGLIVLGLVRIRQLLHYKCFNPTYLYIKSIV